MKFRVVKRKNPMNPSEENYYACPCYMEQLTLRDLAKEISDGCTLNVTDVEAVLTSLVRKLPLFLKSGFKILLGSFGRMKLSFSSKGAEKASDVNADSISSIKILFTPSSELKSEIANASFTKIALAGDAVDGD